MLAILSTLCNVEAYSAVVAGGHLQIGNDPMTDNFRACEDQTGVEAVLDDIIDLEDFAKRGERPPLARGYRLKINGDPYVLHDPVVTGRAILTLAGLFPAENYTLRLKLAGERPRKVGLDECVDLRHPGLEKFKALPRDQTEG